MHIQDTYSVKPLALVLGEDPEIRNIARECLVKEGLDTLEFTSGPEVVGSIDCARTRLVVVDELVHGSDGFRTCREIRTAFESACLPILAILDTDDEHSIAMAFEEGATDLISKPIKPLLLGSKVRSLVRTSMITSMYHTMEKRSRNIIQALPDLVLVLDPAGKILEVKSQDGGELSIPAKDALSRTITDLLPPYIADTALRHVGMALVGSGSMLFEYSIPTDWGTAHYEVRMTKIGTGEVLTVIRDITHVKLKDAEIKRHHEDIEDLVRERTAELSDTVARLSDEVAERKRISEALTMLDKAVTTSKTGITITDTNRKIIYVNPADAAMHGYTPDELLGKNAGIYAPGGIDFPLSPLDYTKITTWSRESENRRKDGSVFPVKLVSDSVRDDDGNIMGLVTTCEDITEARTAADELRRYQAHLEELVEERTNDLSIVVGRLEAEVEERKKKEREIKHLAFYDSLTGLPNRTYLNEQLVYALIKAEVSANHVALMYIDLDNFKRVNDTLGHSLGDMLLKSVGTRLARSLRKTDSVVMPHLEDDSPLVSRLGGDEFIIMLPGIVNPDDAGHIAQRIIDLMSEPFILECHEVFITPSIGVTLYPAHGSDPDSLMMKADTALYHAKDLGKNRYALYSESMTRTAMEKLVLENDLHKAIHREELSMYFQPLYDIQTGLICNMEALLRWNHPTQGFISPADFVPVAEQCGLIMPIGKWVLSEVLGMMKSWLDQGLDPVPVAVNLSANQFIQQNIVKQVRNMLDKYDIPAHYLELELTESSLMKNPDETIRRLGMLKSMGIRLSIDDFGTGYSSLSYLSRLPLDALKIDKVFVQGVGLEPNSESIIKAIIALGHSMDLTVVAEGVETEQQRDFLKGQGCDTVQGYYYSKPLPEGDVSELLRLRILKEAAGM